METNVKRLTSAFAAFSSGEIPPKMSSGTYRSLPLSGSLDAFNAVCLLAYDDERVITWLALLSLVRGLLALTCKRFLRGEGGNLCT